MMLNSQRPFRAQIVPLRRRSRIAGRQIAVAVGWMAREAQVHGLKASVRVRAILAECAAAAVPRIGFRPSLEMLESRTLLSAVSFSNGVLTLTGDAGAANSLTVDLQSNGGFWANADGHVLSTNPGAVSKISITGGSGADWIYINSGISTAAVINTLGGTDTVRGGGGYDTITSGRWQRYDLRLRYHDAR